MNNIFFVFAFIFIPNLVFTQSSDTALIKIDTVILSDNIKYTSDLKFIIATCIGHNIFETASLTMKRSESTISLFNKELGTKIFEEIKVVTGISIKTSLTENWMTIMEWHFRNEEESEKIEKKLNQLDKGIIRHTIVPAACYWIRTGKKIYVIRYGPRKGGNKVVEDVFSCLKSSIN